MLPIDAPWLADFEDEVLSFPSSDHDDMVDAFVMGLAQAKKQGPSSISFAWGNDGALHDVTNNGEPYSFPDDDIDEDSFGAPIGVSGGIGGYLGCLGLK
jgi:hypothetical protein